jgi:hypothetical protein
MNLILEGLVGVTTAIVSWHWLTSTTQIGSLGAGILLAMKEMSLAVPEPCPTGSRTTTPLLAADGLGN